MHQAGVIGHHQPRRGEQVVKQVCGGCHERGKGGAPRIGDRAAWAKRVANGINAVTDSAIHGHAGMPARGGMASITDPEMKAAVLYMFNAGGAILAADAGAYICICESICTCIRFLTFMADFCW